MAANIKIIEFYGLPGCGKTTLRNQLIQSPLKRFGTINEVMTQYKKESLIYRITHLPLKQWWQLTLFILSLSNIRSNRKSFYVVLYYKTLAYSYCREKSIFDYVVVDHGLVQQVGSILHNMNYDLSEKSLGKLSRFLYLMKETKTIYCQIPSELSLSRIKKRNRDSGRIDAMMYDREKALYYLEKEKSFFERISKTTKDINDVLDMTRAPEELMLDIIRIED